MEKDSILQRLHELEREVISLRSQLTPVKHPWRRILAKSGMFLVSYWVLMSFFAAIATATYVKFAFNIDYFEAYRNAAAVKRLSEFHRQMGDEMFLRNNWKQALDSYKAATAANPANTAAAVGEVKATVMMPEAGHQFSDPSVVATKLDKLRELYPNDPQVAYLDAMQAFSNGQTAKSLELCNAVLAKFRRFPGGYLLKGYLQQNNADFKGAIKTLEELLTIDPDNGMGQSNLGYCYLLTGQTESAMKQLENGMRNYPTMINAISLAEALRMAGNFEQAGRLLDQTDRFIAMPGMEDEYFFGGQWLWNHLPEKAGDTVSSTATITCSTPDQKRAVLRISQGMLDLTAGKDDPALERFRETLKLEPLYRDFLVNKLRATVYSGIGVDAKKTRMTSLADRIQAGGNL